MERSKCTFEDQVTTIDDYLDKYQKKITRLCFYILKSSMGFEPIP